MKTRVLFSPIFADVFSFFNAFLDGERAAVYPKKKSLLLCILRKSLALQRAQTGGQLSKMLFCLRLFSLSI